MLLITLSRQVATSVWSFPILLFSLFLVCFFPFVVNSTKVLNVSSETQQLWKIVHPQISPDDDFWGCGVFLHIYHSVFCRVVCWNAMMNTSSLKHCRFRYSSRCRDKCPPPMHLGLLMLHNLTSNWWRPSAPRFWKGRWDHTGPWWPRMMLVRATSHFSINVENDSYS